MIPLSATVLFSKLTTPYKKEATVLKKILMAMLLVAVVGCKGKTGPTGATGATGTTGPTGTSGTNTSNVYTARFQTGVYPSTAYAGVTFNRIDSLNASTNYPNDGKLIFASTSTGEKSALLVKFDIAGLIPSNATLTTAAIELVTTSATTLTGAVTIGVHKIGGYGWTYQASWNREDGSVYWGISPFGSNCYGSVMGTAVLPVSYTGATNRIGIDVSTATIAAWMSGTNNGLAIVSENEGTDATGSVVFSAPNDSNVSYRPVLEVNYTL
jgi:hypothetical protein